jgi:tRNA-dihydrouridine synthase B
MIAIGPYNLDNNVALAPMAGVTDLPFRRLCRRMGAGLVVSEMVTSDTRLWNSRKSRQRLVHSHECEPRSVQIAGAEPAMMAEAAIRNVALGAQIIDINMGCPAKKVCKKAAGSALLRDEELVRAILEAVVGAVEVPVTLKIRTGWSPEHRNGVQIARIAEDAGIALLSVHGRTRACRFNGEAEYATIADICRAVDIPVLANGDIDSPESAAAVLEQTGAAGVMIGRAAQGRPWLCGQVAHYLRHGKLAAEPDGAKKSAIMVEHLRSLYDFYGEYMGLRIARKHIGWYLQHATRGDAFRRSFNRLESAAEQLAAIDTFLNNDDPYEELAA